MNRIKSFANNVSKKDNARICQLIDDRIYKPTFNRVFANKDELWLAKLQLYGFIAGERPAIKMHYVIA